MKISVKTIARTALIGALYALITLVSAPISFGPIQLRLSESLMVLPYFFPELSPGLILGCAISNMGSVYGIYDVVFGTLATAVTVILISLFGKKSVKISKVATVLTPGIVNGLVIGAMMAFITMPEGGAFKAFLVYSAEIFTSETAVMLMIGLPILIKLPKTRFFDLLAEK